MKIPDSTIILLAFSALAAQSQGGQSGAPLPEFEVASVKPSNPDIFDVSNHIPDLNVEPGRTLNIANITLKDILKIDAIFGTPR